MSMKKYAIRVMAMVLFFSPVVVLAGGSGEMIGYFHGFRQGNQSVTLIERGVDLGFRKVTLQVDKDAKMATVTMTKVVVNVGSGPGGRQPPKDIAARSFTSAVEQLEHNGSPAIRVVDPKDNGKFIFILKEGKVIFIGNGAGGTKKWDTEMR